MTQVIEINNVSSYRLIAGSPVYLNLTFGWVNVKDVALAHVLACEVPSASGRYCMVDRVIHFSEIVKIIHEMYPSLPVPEKQVIEHIYCCIFMRSMATRATTSLRLSFIFICDTAWNFLLVFFRINHDINFATLVLSFST